MLMLLLLLGLVIWAGTEFGDTVGTVLLGGLIVLLVVLFCSGWSRDGRAYRNWVDYWAEKDRR